MQGISVLYFLYYLRGPHTTPRGAGTVDRLRIDPLPSNIPKLYPKCTGRKSCVDTCIV